MAAADSEKRYALIQENLAEVLNEEIIKKILDEGKHPKIYWGAWADVVMPQTCPCLVRANHPVSQAPPPPAARTAATSSPPSRSPSSSPPAAT
jgi:hypothetical protein